MKIRLLFDVDGPLTNGFVEQSCKFLREVCRYPDAIPENADRWEFIESYNVSAEDKRRTENSFRAPGIANTFVPNPGAVEFIAWCQTWADVYAVTAPWKSAPTWTYDRDQWLRRHFNLTQVVHTAHKHVVVGDVLVDDKLKNLQDWYASHPKGLPVLWRMPQNRHDIWHLEASDYTRLRKLLEPLQ